MTDTTEPGIDLDDSQLAPNTLQVMSAQIERLTKERDSLMAACIHLEEWWLRQGMHAFDGAPACIFNLRALLHPTKRSAE